MKKIYIDTSDEAEMTREKLNENVIIGYGIDGEIVGVEVILSGDIGRIRDFEIDQEGDIYLIADLRKSPVWKLTR